MLSDGLVGVQRGKFALDDGLCTLDGCVNEVLVHFLVCTVFLHALEVRFAGEGLHDLELFVPITHGRGVIAIERRDGLADTLKVGNLNLLLLRHEPMGDWLRDR